MQGGPGFGCRSGPRSRDLSHVTIGHGIPETLISVISIKWRCEFSFLAQWLVYSDVEQSCTLESSIWSQLPMEIVQEVVLILATSSTHDALNLRLVSRYFNSCVLPILFQHLRLQSTDQILRFAAVILPKKKSFIPALKSTRRLHDIPRALDTYSVTSLALSTTDCVPSVENALESIAPVFVGLQYLAITSQNLSSHGYWIRKHPIRPRKVMILHFGRPAPFNFREPLFSSVTHLFTPLLFDGLRESSVSDLTSLTHLAVYTRSDITAVAIRSVTRQIHEALDTVPRLQRLVLSSDRDLTFLRNWVAPLKECLQDHRFIILPSFRGALKEWEEMLSGDCDIWARADEWEMNKPANDYWYRSAPGIGVNMRDMMAILSKRSYPEWDIDLVEKADFLDAASDPARRSKCLSLVLRFS